MEKFKVGILGATGMVGQRFITQLRNHPWFEIACVAASSYSAGKTYKEAAMQKWKMKQAIPSTIAKYKVLSVEDDIEQISSSVDLVFSALDTDKNKIKKIELLYAEKNIPVISNNSAHRWTPEVPMIIPEVNPHHTQLIDAQRKKNGWKKGFIVVKPNCSIQSYVMVLTALREFQPLKIRVTSLQAISGAGKTFKSWAEMKDNVIPYINGEEEKSEQEPLKIWGALKDNSIQLAQQPVISATCIRIPVTDGHMASVSVTFTTKPSKQQILGSIHAFTKTAQQLKLPSTGNRPCIQYLSDNDRPQTRLDRDSQFGMSITFGRLEEDSLFDWKFVALSHNTIRGAAGGAILLAELLVRQQYITRQNNN
ncbi:aspartate-semialdehyde dehydrogenase [Candidatus Roizmanbacteria bacterium]|nr:aspartate-semialdehyde dehydrogenase [Candidatus Roizmanbacteria bacterium]